MSRHVQRCHYFGGLDDSVAIYQHLPAQTGAFLMLLQPGWAALVPGPAWCAWHVRMTHHGSMEHAVCMVPLRVIRHDVQ